MMRLLLLFFLFWHISFAQDIFIVAKVDQRVITSLELETREKLIILLNDIPPFNSTQEEATFRRQILEMMIDEQVKLIYTEELNISVSRQEVEQYIENLLNLDPLAADKINIIRDDKVLFTSFQEQVRAEIAWYKVSQGILVPRIKISNDEMESHIRKTHEDTEKAYNNLMMFKLNNMSRNLLLKVKQKFFIEIK